MSAERNYRSPMVDKIREELKKRNPEKPKGMYDFLSEIDILKEFRMDFSCDWVNLMMIRKIEEVENRLNRLMKALGEK